MENINESELYNIQNDCNYVTTVPNVEGNFNIIHLNIRSLKNKLDDLHSLLVRTSITWDVICIAESWLKNDILQYYNLENYNLVASCRDSGEGGGVALYIHEKYSIKERVDLLSADCEASFVEITMNTRTGTSNMLVGELYRPPNQSSQVFMNYLENLLEKLENERKTTIIAGDFNYNLLASSRNDCNTFKNMIESYGFLQTIWKATRKTNQCESLLDNIFVNDLTIFKSSGILIEDMSDHLPIFASLSIEKSKPDKRKQITTFDRHRMPELVDYLSEKLKRFQNNTDANVACNQIVQAYEDGINKFSKTYIPSRRKTPIKPWITAGLLCSINMKNKLYKKFLRSMSTANENKYKTYRNILTNLMKDAKKAYIQKSLATTNDSKETWDVLNSLINKGRNNKHKYPSTFYDNKGQCYRDKEVAEGFNSFFSSVGVELEKDIPISDKCPLEYIKELQYDCLENIKCITPEDVKRVIRSLRSVGGGLDGINTFILKGTYRPLLNELTFFFNLCLKTATFPEKLKVAIIVPIYKAGSKDLFNNYRPISLLPMFSKVLEKIIYEQITSYLNDNNFFNPLQFGFRKSHSTYMPIAHMHDEVMKSLINNEVICSLYLDLKKAFDTVSLKILLQKIKHAGIQGNLYNLLDSYLSNRQQMTKIENVLSSRQIISSGVPQGSILGPLLFIIYINDICNITDQGTLYLFADDTAICISGRNYEDLQIKINNVVPNIMKWLHANRLSVNAAKTNYQIYSMSSIPDLDIRLDGTQISRKKCIKYLGVLVDENMKWRSHIDSVATKISRNLGIIGRSKHYLTSEQLRLLYNALILPHLNYCAVVWGVNYQTAISRLVLLQKRAVRLIDKKPYLSPSKPLFIKHRLLRFPEIVQEQCIMIMLAHLKENLPKSISDMFRYALPSSTRLKKHFEVPFAATNYRSFTLSCSAPKAWNKTICNLYKDLADVPRDKRLLKKTVRNHFFNKYSFSEM